MNLTRDISFLLSAAASIFLLWMAPVDDAKVALLRLDKALFYERTLKQEIAGQCTTLIARTGNPAERFFIDRYAPPRQEGGVAQPCVATLTSTSVQRFFVRSYTTFSLRVQTEGGAPFFERSYPVEFPRPLCFLPLLLFLLAVVFEYHRWSLAPTLVAYLVLLAGGNAIRTSETVFKSTLTTLTGTPSFGGLMLIALWLALFLSGRDQQPVPAKDVRPAERWFGLSLQGLLGLWNPSAFSLLGRLFAPARGAAARLRPFLDHQFLVACLSLYLFNPAFVEWKDFARRSVLAPRYFTFSAILFLTVPLFTRRPGRFVAVTRYQRLWVAGLFVLASQLLPLRFPALAEISNPTRVGVALLLSEALWPTRVRLGRAAELFFPWAAALFLGSFIAVVSQEAGVTDLVLALASPKIHPSVFALLCFVAGMILGLLTGDFATAYFALALALSPGDQPQARGALLDGIMAGVLVSPFSLFNLLPSAQFSIPIQRLVAFRWRQVAFPLWIGAVLFALGSISSVAILQPVTFVFLCLVAVAWQLKKRTWTLDAMTIPEYMRSSL